MRQSLFAMSMFLLAAGNMHAQKLSIENVQKVSLRNSEAIKEGSDVKGYYFFYVSDKIDKKTNEYTLQITDNNLKKLKDIKFQDSKDVSILESSFNGTDLIFLFHNSKDRTFEYQVYGADGKKKYSYTRELTKKEERFLEGTYLGMNDDDETFKGLYPIEGKGFISNTPSREDKDYTFQVDYFGTDKRKQWSYSPTEGGKRFIGDYLGSHNGTVFMQVLRFGGGFDQNPDSYIIGLDMETGRQMFEKPTDGKNKFYPANMSTNNGKAYMFGEYFEPGANIMKAKSRGFAFWTIDEKGKLLAEKYSSWDSDMAKYLDVSANGKVDDFGFLFLHSMTQTADGNIYAVGEGFKKVASALGIAATVLTKGGGAWSNIKVKVTDMMMLTFDKDFNIKGAKIFEKNSNNVELPGGYELVGTTKLGKLIKYDLGRFDYSYTQANKDLTSFSVCYSDFVRGKDYKGGTFNSITCTDGKITTDKINTKTDASRSMVLPGKQGQVLMVDYYRKDKKLDMHFEKLN